MRGSLSAVSSIIATAGSLTVGEPYVTGGPKPAAPPAYQDHVGSGRAVR
jgi:hypothetical protein